MIKSLISAGRLHYLAPIPQYFFFFALIPLVFNDNVFIAYFAEITIKCGLAQKTNIVCTLFNWKFIQIYAACNISPNHAQIYNLPTIIYDRHTGHFEQICCCITICLTSTFSNCHCSSFCFIFFLVMRGENLNFLHTKVVNNMLWVTLV